MSTIAPIVERVLPKIDLAAGQSVDSLFGSNKPLLEQAIAKWLPVQRWFGAKDKTIEGVKLLDTLELRSPLQDIKRAAGHLTIAEVSYVGGGSDLYLMPLAARAASRAGAGVKADAIAQVDTARGAYYLFDASKDRRVNEAMTAFIANQEQVVGRQGVFRGVLDDPSLLVQRVKAHPKVFPSSNTNTILNAAKGGDPADPQFMKIERNHPGKGNPDGERARDMAFANVLHARNFPETPKGFGSIEYAGNDGSSRTLVMLGRLEPNQGDLWDDAQRSLEVYLQPAVARVKSPDQAVRPALARKATAELDDHAELSANYGETLGRMHLASAAGPADSRFRLYEVTRGEQIKRAEQLQTEATRIVELMRENKVGDETLYSAITGRADQLAEASRTGPLVPDIMVHGDLHGAQALRVPDKKVKIIDLGGPVSEPVAERWRPRQALYDVARQRSSFNYSAAKAIEKLVDEGTITKEQASEMRAAALAWSSKMRERFGDNYLDTVADAPFVPAGRDAIRKALDEADFGNVLYEMEYEIKNRPDWAWIPVAQLRELTGLA